MKDLLGPSLERQPQALHTKKSSDATCKQCNSKPMCGTQLTTLSLASHVATNTQEYPT